MTQPRTVPPYDAGEQTLLLAYLDHHRATLLEKTAGLTPAQLQQTLAPSEMTLGGMLKHCAYNEATWFGERFAGQEVAEPWASVDWAADVDWDWHSAIDDSPDELVALWQREVGRARAAYDGASLDDVAHKPLRDGGRPTLRWILLHLVEEYARHNGHADLIRESIDGSVGE